MFEVIIMLAVLVLLLLVGVLISCLLMIPILSRMSLMGTSKSSIKRTSGSRLGREHD